MVILHKDLLIDNFAFAREALTIERSVDISLLPRLVEFLQENYPSESIQNSQSKQNKAEDSKATLIRFTLIGAMDEFKNAYLELDILADLVLVCQRCLADMPYNISTSKRYNIVKNHSDTNWKNEDSLTEDEELDASVSFSVLTLLEEEIILSLPLVPRHDDCKIDKRYIRQKEDNPFAGLRALT